MDESPHCGVFLDGHVEVDADIFGFYGLLQSVQLAVSVRDADVADEFCIDYRTDHVRVTFESHSKGYQMRGWGDATGEVEGAANVIAQHLRRLKLPHSIVVYDPGTSDETRVHHADHHWP